MTISQINLGSFYTNSSGTSVSSGLSSGLNTQAVIASLTAAQSAQITSLNDQVTVNNNQVTALSSLQQILTSLQTAVTALSNPQSADTTDNLWAVRTSNITSNTAQAASNYLTATVASGTNAGNYTISNITQLAQGAVQETGTFGSVTASVVSSTGTTGQFTAGTLVIENPNGTTSGSVTLNAGDTLDDVADDFNAASAQTGIAATVLQTSAGVYKLVFSSTTTGASTNFDLGSTATVTSNQSLLSNISFATDQTGQDAIFQLNNVTIDRSSNTISDLISGVTLNLLQNTASTPSASFNLQITPDTTSIETGIDNFATAYNNFLYFYSQQTQLGTTGAPASAAVLYSDTTLQNIFNQVTTEASALVTGLSKGQPNSLASVGITFTDYAGSTTVPATSNILSVDDSTLLSNLQSNFSGVENVFGYNMTSSSPNLLLFQSSNNQTASDFTVNVDQTASPPTYTATYVSSTGANITVNFDATPLSTGGATLTGPAGSEIAGLELIYGASGNESNIQVKTTQGLAASISNILTSALQTNTGLVASDVTAIDTKTTTLQDQITTVTTQLTNKRTELLQQYSALESAINSSNSILDELNANQLAGSSS